VAGLFRIEVLEHRERDWLGSIQLTRPVSLTVLTVLALLAAAAVGTGLVLGEYTRKARVTGHLVPDRGVIRLMAPQAATVKESHVAEGRTVRRGDVLFVLGVGQATLSGDTQGAVQSSIAARASSLRGAARQRELLEQNQIAALDRQVDDMQRELGSMKVETDLQTQRLALAELAQEGFVRRDAHGYRLLVAPQELYDWPRPADSAARAAC
jgi:membrane fusion protein